MVVPLFGWSAGDIVVSIKILSHVAEAFHESGGAKDQHAECSTWLKSFADDLERVKEYVNEHPDAKHTKNIKDQIKNISPHYALFEKYLQGFDKAFDSTSSVTNIEKAAKKAKWAIKELKGHVDELKMGVNGPMMAVNLLLLLQGLSVIDHVADKDDIKGVQQRLMTMEGHLQQAEHSFMSLHASLNAQKETLDLLQQPHVASPDQQLLAEIEKQKTFTSDILGKLDDLQHQCRQNWTKVDKELGMLVQVAGSGATDLVATLDHQKVLLRTCQSHLESISSVTERIRKDNLAVKNSTRPTDWLPVVNATTAVAVLATGLFNALSIAGLRTMLQRSLTQSMTQNQALTTGLSESKSEPELKSSSQAVATSLEIKSCSEDSVTRSDRADGANEALYSAEDSLCSRAASLTNTVECERPDRPSWIHGLALDIWNRKRMSGQPESHDGQIQESAQDMRQSDWSWLLSQLGSRDSRTYDPGLDIRGHEKEQRQLDTQREAHLDRTRQESARDLRQLDWRQPLPVRGSRHLSEQDDEIEPVELTRHGSGAPYVRDDVLEPVEVIVDGRPYHMRSDGVVELMEPLNRRNDGGVYFDGPHERRDIGDRRGYNPGGVLDYNAGADHRTEHRGTRTDDWRGERSGEWRRDTRDDWR